MKLKTKFGFVVLLDALGTRTATLENASDYLNAITTIQKGIKETTDLTLDKIEDTDIKIKLSDLKPRFFGDSILLTYEIKNLSLFEEYLKRLVFVIGNIIPNALELGILFRGSFTIGEYLEKRDVVLGPAVFDVANWYEQVQLLSIVATPKTTNYLKGFFSKEADKDLEFIYWKETDGLFLYNSPIKNGIISSYVVDWPHMISDENAYNNPLPWYYEAIKKFEIPIGTENKYSNTEEFIKYSSKLNKQKKQAKAPQPNSR